jgi:hypothetical protein
MLPTPDRSVANFAHSLTPTMIFADNGNIGRSLRVEASEPPPTVVRAGKLHNLSSNRFHYRLPFHPARFFRRRLRRPV